MGVGEGGISYSVDIDSLPGKGGNGGLVLSFLTFLDRERRAEMEG